MADLDVAVWELAETLNQYEKYLDCGDNSCMYARSKGGMRTNGGCRCKDKPFVSSALSLIIQAARKVAEHSPNRDEE